LRFQAARFRFVIWIKKPADLFAEATNTGGWFCCCQDEEILRGVAACTEMPTLQIDYKWKLRMEGIARG
jgi:hypothetical protein